MHSRCPCRSPRFPDNPLNAITCSLAGRGSAVDSEGFSIYRAARVAGRICGAGAPVERRKPAADVVFLPSAAQRGAGLCSREEAVARTHNPEPGFHGVVPVGMGHAVPHGVAAAAGAGDISGLSRSDVCRHFPSAQRGKARGLELALRANREHCRAGLLIITIFKCFIHDLSRLGELYRVMSFVGLAVCLALVALAYQKFVFAQRKQE